VDALGRVRRGEWADPGKVTVAEYLERWERGRPVGFGVRATTANTNRFTGVGRDARAWAEHEERIARQSVPLAQDRLAEADSELRRLEAAHDARQAFDRREAWRHDRLAQIDERLEHHWADVVLSAVRQGDPLAYGPERLRQSRSTYAADLSRLEPGHALDRRRRGGWERDAALTAQPNKASRGSGELSAAVAELDQSIDACAPSPLQQSLAFRAEHRFHELDVLRHPPLHPDYGHELGLGR
jgi:hypothetical protein